MTERKYGDVLCWARKDDKPGKYIVMWVAPYEAYGGFRGIVVEDGEYHDAGLEGWWSDDPGDWEVIDRA